MSADLVATLQNLPGGFGMSLHLLTDQEKSGFHLLFFQGLEKLVGIGRVRAVIEGECDHSTIRFNASDAIRKPGKGEQSDQNYDDGPISKGFHDLHVQHGFGINLAVGSDFEDVDEAREEALVDGVAVDGFYAVIAQGIGIVG